MRTKKENMEGKVATSVCYQAERGHTAPQLAKSFPSLLPHSIHQ